MVELREKRHSRQQQCGGGDRGGSGQQLSATRRGTQRPNDDEARACDLEQVGKSEDCRHASRLAEDVGPPPADQNADEEDKQPRHRRAVTFRHSSLEPPLTPPGDERNRSQVHGHCEPRSLDRKVLPIRNRRVAYEPRVVVTGTDKGGAQQHKGPVGCRARRPPLQRGPETI